MNTLPPYCRAFCGALMLFASLALSQGAAAATFTVNSTADTPDASVGNGACADAAGACTLRAAIQEANALAGADTINITATGTINLTGALPGITSDMKLNGPGSSLLVVRRDTGGDYRIFSVNTGIVTISGMTVTNGKARAGANSNFGERGGDGGGIMSFGMLTLTDVAVIANSAGAGGEGVSFGGKGGSGGGIYNAGTLIMANCTVSGNTGGRGGNGNNGPGDGGPGGGVYNSNTLTIIGCVITGNAGGRGGDGSSWGGSGGSGGGIFTENGLFNFTNLTVSNNSAGDHGNTGGGGGGSGGGIYISTGAGTLTDSTVSDNRAGRSVAGGHGYAGGIENGGALTLVGSTVSGNNSGSSGGGFLNRRTLTLINSTVSGNTSGGGIVNDSSAALSLTNCTVAQNSGYGIFTHSSNATVANTIIAGNSLGDVSGTFNSRGYNLVGNATGNLGHGNSGFSASGDQVGTSASPLDPKLSPLAPNGGPTLTHALLPNSPALDAGSNALARDASNNPLTADQRGVARVRPSNAGGPAVVDIGAFEFQPSLEDVSDKATNEDTAVTVFFSVGDADPTGTSVTAASGNQALVPDANLSITGSGPVRTLRVTPAPNQSGAAVITLTATTSAGQVSSDTFTLTVNPVNDAPTFTGADQLAAEDAGAQSVAGWATNLSAGPNESGQSLSFQVTGNTNPGLFSSAPAVSTAGTLSYTPAADASGVATVTVVLRDDGGVANGGQDTSTPQTFQITVAPVNDGPALIVPGPQTVAENSALFFSGSSRRVAISDIDAQTGHVVVTLAASGGSVTLSSIFGLTFTAGDGSGDATMTFTGTVTNVNIALDGLFFIPTSGFTGQASLTVTVNDQGNTGAGGALGAAGTIDITVEEGGTLQFGATTYSVGEGSGPAVVTVTRAGGAAGSTSVRYSLTNGTATAGSDFFGTSGTVFFGPGETSKTFTVSIINDSFNEADETVNITLSNVTGSGELGSPATAVLTIVNDDAPTVSFKDGSYVFNEAHVRALVTVARGGDRRLPASVKFQTLDDPAAVPCDPAAKRPDGTEYPRGAAYARCDYATTVETLNFAANEAEKQIAIPIIDDAHPDGVENLQLRLSEPQGATLGPRPEAALTITDNDAAGQPNPVGTTPFFVRQHYLDFLSREPELGEPWSGVLGGCADVSNTDPDSPSAGCDRLLVSQSFFQSPEFQLKGLYSYLFYRVAFGRRPAYEEITPDMRSLAGATPQEVFARRTLYASTVAQRAEFTQLYGQMTNQQYVEALLGRHNLQQITTEDPANFEGEAQVTLTRQQLIDALDANTLTRAQALRAVVQSSEVDAAEYHGAFVSMQYYGYLRRTPEQSGYDAWLRVIREDPQNVRLMVNGFLNSQEYRLRFGQP